MTYRLPGDPAGLLRLERVGRLLGAERLRDRLRRPARFGGQARRHPRSLGRLCRRALAFGLGSALSAGAPSLGLLIAARVIKGAGAAAVTPTSLGLLLPAFGTPSGAAAATDTCSRVSPRICSTNLPALDPRGRQDAAPASTA